MDSDTTLGAARVEARAEARRLRAAARRRDRAARAALTEAAAQAHAEAVPPWVRRPVDAYWVTWSRGR